MITPQRRTSIGATVPRGFGRGFEYTIRKGRWLSVRNNMDSQINMDATTNAKNYQKTLNKITSSLPNFSSRNSLGVPVRAIIRKSWSMSKRSSVREIYKQKTNRKTCKDTNINSPEHAILEMKQVSKFINTKYH